MDIENMTRREVLDAKLGDEARQIQPRRFEIVLRCVARRPSSDDVARFSHPTQPRRDAISAPFPPPRRALSLTRPPLATPRRKPLAPVNGWSNVLAPKSAFKTPGVTPGGGLTRRVSFKPDPAVADDAAWRSLETPAQRPPASRRRVTHRRAGMRARKGTGRAVAARTFSLVLRAPHERVNTAVRGGDDDANTEPGDASRANGARSQSASADTGSHGGSGGSVNAGDAFDEARDLGRYFSSAKPGIDVAPAVDTPASEDGFHTRVPAAGRPSLVPYALTPTDTEEGTFAHAAGGSRGGAPAALADASDAAAMGGNPAMFDDDFNDGFGFEGGYDGDDADAFFGATPAAIEAKMLVDGGNDPMTDRGEGKKPRTPLRRLAGVKRPAGTPHKRERKRFERRKSLTSAGLRDDLMETEDGRPLRRSTRERTKPLEYWRGETKKYSRVHQSLPTVEVVRTRTPNPAWPLLPTPYHAHGAGGEIVITDHVRDWSQKDSRRKKATRPTEEESRRAGEEARKRALALADVAHLSDSELDDDDDDEVGGVELNEEDRGVSPSEGIEIVEEEEETPAMAMEPEAAPEPETADATVDEEAAAEENVTPEKEEDEAPEPVVVEVPVVVEEPEEAMPAVDESTAVEVPEEVMPAPEPFAVDDAATEEVPAIPAPDVDVTAMEEEEVHLDEAAATTLEPTIEPVAEETAAADETIADEPAEENDAAVFMRPESPPRRVTRRSARNLLDETADALEDATIDEKEDGAAEPEQAEPEQAEPEPEPSPPRRVTRRSRSASLASTADADKTMEADEEEEEEEVDLEAKTVSPPRRSTRRSARNANVDAADTEAKTVSPKSTGRRVTRRSSRAASVAGDLDETVRVDED